MCQPLGRQTRSYVIDAKYTSTSVMDDLESLAILAIAWKFARSYHQRPCSRRNIFSADMAGARNTASSQKCPRLDSGLILRL